MKRYKYTEDQLREAVKNSICIRGVLSCLGIVTAGGNYSTTKKRIKGLQLDTSHFTGMAWSKNKKLGSKRPIEEYLSNKYFIGSNNLKQRLIKEKIFNRLCSNCLLDTWLSKPIPLELDHINGNHDDNSLSNIRLLCPNCHAQTNNYRGKNKGNYK